MAEVSKLFFVKDKIIQISGFAGHTISVETTHFCPWSAKAATDKTYMNQRGYTAVTFD